MSLWDNGDLQKGRMPQLTLHPQICSLNILWLGNGETEAEAALCPPLAGEADMAPWHPTGTMHPQNEPVAMCLLSCFQSVPHKARNWMDRGRR